MPLARGTPPDVAARRIVAIADGYRLDEQGRSELADLLHRRIMSMYKLLHDGHLHDGHRADAQPWSRLWDEGHGDVWLANAEWVRENRAVLRTALANHG